MTQLIVDGFATYGLGTRDLIGGGDGLREAMLAGAWADAPSQFFLGQLPFGPADTATYFGNADRWPIYTSAGNADRLRRVLPGSRTNVIIALRLAMNSLPTQDNICEMIRFCAGAVAPTDLVLYQQSNGYLAASVGGSILGTTQGPVMVAGSAKFVEAQLSTTSQHLQVYVDGTLVLDVTNAAISTAAITQFCLIGQPSSSSGAGGVYITDLIVRDTNGTRNNSVMGDRRVATLMVNRDDPAHQGWTPRPIQRFGNSVLQNTQRGSSSGVFCAGTTATDLGSGDFTIEGQFRFANLPTGANKAQLFGKWQEDNNQRSWRLYLGGPTLDSGMFTFQCSTDGTNGTVTTLFRWPWQPKTGQWYHVAVSRVSGQLRVFVDGVILGTPIADANTYFAGTARTAVMAQCNNSPNGVTGTKFDGFQDEFRLTVGVGRYTANFAPPSAAFPRGGGDPNWSSVQWLSGWENGIFDDSSAGRTLTRFAAGTDLLPTSLTPNDGAAAYLTINEKAPPYDFNFIEAALVPATSLLTLTANPTNGETVRVGTKNGTNAAVYTFKTALAAAYDVLIGATADDSLVNLVAAIMKGTGEGTVYGTGTDANFDVSATKMPTTQILATALVAGTVGNSIVTTETLANGSWTGGTLAGGANIPPYSQFGFQRPPNNTTVVDSITLVMRAWKTDAGPATVKQSFVGPGGAVADGADKNVATNPTLYFDTFELDPDTSAPLTPTTIVSGFMKVNRTS